MIKNHPYIKFFVRVVMAACFLTVMSRTGHGANTLEYWLVFVGIICQQILNENI